VIGGDGIENKIETPGVLFHFVAVARDNDLVGTEAECIFFLAG